MNKKFLLTQNICMIFLLLLGWACDTNHQEPAPPLAKSVEQEAISDVNTQTDEILTEREFPRITTQNAEEFLLQYFKDNPERKIKLTTRLGDMKIKLFDDTPLHTANFLMLVKRKYFNNTEFTRVIEEFVVQGGNNEKEEEELKRIHIGIYLLPAEITEQHLHKKGALAMARSYNENPHKLSSAYDFYFVQGRVLNEPQLMALERDHEIRIPEWKREIYRTLGGAPHLDGEHTVFGEIYEGLDVLAKISREKTDDGDWPLDPVIMQMEVIYE